MLMLKLLFRSRVLWGLMSLALCATAVQGYYSAAPIAVHESSTKESLIRNNTASDKKSAPINSLAQDLNLKEQSDLSVRAMFNRKVGKREQRPDELVTVISPVNKKLETIEQIISLNSFERSRIERKLQDEYEYGEGSGETFKDILGEVRAKQLEDILGDIDKRQKRVALTKALIIWSDKLSTEQRDKLD